MSVQNGKSVNRCRLMLALKCFSVFHLLLPRESRHFLIRAFQWYIELIYLYHQTKLFQRKLTLSAVQI